MRASIIVIGDEILLGQVTDTNSGEIARALNPMGWEIVSTRVVGDSCDGIAKAVKVALGEAELVITTGGLGPTKDDVTKKALLELFGGELKEDASVLENVKQIFAKRGLTLNALTLGQAMVPTSCRIIQNQLGTAPIMWFERDNRVLVSMPGVPFETVGMLHKAVLGEIKNRFAPDAQYMHRTFIVTGITESALAELLSGYETSLPPHMHLAYLPVPGYIRLRLDSTIDAGDQRQQGEFEEKADELAKALGKLKIHDGDATPAEMVLETLKARGLTLATAESCTGGNIAHQITLVPGSSECFLGSVVSYSNSVKHGVLGVSKPDLERFGAVSEPVVRQMAEGAARVTGATCSVATSGIAGPGGGTPEKPVGTVWIAACCKGEAVTKKFKFPGDRSRVIERATTEALLMLHALASGRVNE